jgi:hypothetical protein
MKRGGAAVKMYLTFRKNGEVVVRMESVKQKTAILSGGILIFALALSLASGCVRSAARESEPNNDAGHANRLSAGQTMEGFFDSADDVDWFRIDVRRPAIFDITLSAVPG